MCRAAWALMGMEMVDGRRLEIWHTSLTGSKKTQTARVALLRFIAGSTGNGNYDDGFLCVRTLSCRLAGIHYLPSLGEEHDRMR